jgi:hypothetical protein
LGSEEAQATSTISSASRTSIASTFCRSVGAVNIEAHTNFDLGRVVLELTGGPTGSTFVTNTAVMGPFYVANGAGLMLEVGSYTIKAWATTLNSATSGTKHATFTVLDCLVLVQL